MQNKSQKTGSSKGMTLVEMTISMAILGIIFAVLLPQLRLISNSWDSKAGRSDALQNGCVLLDHLQRTLQTARRITAVSGAGEALGYIEFEDNAENSFRYDIDGGTSYVEFGVPGNLYDLAGPVSQFRVSCYSLLDVDNPMDPITDPNRIRCVEVEVTLANSAAMGGDVTMSTAAMLRNDSVVDETEPNDLNLLFVVDNATMLSIKDSGRRALMESWGLTVNLIDHFDTQTNFDAAAGAADVVYVSGTVSGGMLLDKLTGSTTGIVSELAGKLDNFGFSSSNSATVLSDGFANTDPLHYITQPFSGNPVVVFQTFVYSMPVPSGNLAPDLQNVAEVLATPTLVALDAGAMRWDGNPAPARRVHLPFGSAETSQFTNEGETLMQRAIEWASGAGSGPAPGFGTYADSFASQSFDGSSGTLDWSTSPWVEIGESDGVSSGDCGIFTDAGLWRLRLRDNDNGGEGVEREADLSGAGSATLEFWYKRYRLDDAGDYVKLEISANGAAGPWTELLRLEGPANDAEYLLESQDISAYISANTRIRFITSPDMGVQDAVWFDDVEILIQP